MLTTNIKDEMNGLLALGFAEIAGLIATNPAKAASLARAFSLMAHLPEAGEYDWHTAFGCLASHYQAFPVEGTDRNFLQAWEELRKLS